MKLNEVHIKGYKSIIEWQKITFNGNLTVLTGKNGVGKTNVLNALQLVFSRGHDFRVRPNDFSYKLILELNNDELKKIGSGFDTTIENRTIEVSYDFDEDSLMSLRIKSKELMEKMKQTTGDAEATLCNLIIDLKEYRDKLERIVSQNHRDPTFKIGTIDLEIHSDKTIYDRIPIRENLNRMLDNAKKIQKKLTAGEDMLNFLPHHEIRFTSDICFPDFQLKHVPVNLTPFQSKFIKVQEKKIGEAIGEMNKELKPLSERICSEIFEFRSLCYGVDVLDDELYTAGDEERKELSSLRQQISDAVGQKVYFLENAASSLFFSTGEDPHRINQNDALIRAFLYYDSPEDADERLKSKIELSDDELERFQKMLNGTRPKFEEKLIKEILVKRNKNSIDILLSGYTGKILNLNESNLGRRWYFTYYFLKQCLKKGDIFIIDEPASFLHPDAQREIYEELCALSESGIRVIYSTHSPYMIPNDLSQLRIMSIDESGTKVKSLDVSQPHIDELRESIGMNTVNDLLLRIGKPIIFVEGERDKVCLEKFMEIFNIEKSNYEIYPCLGYPTVTMGWISMKIGIPNFKVLLDRDNQDEGHFEGKEKVLKERLDYIVAGNFVVFVPPCGVNGKELEDMFRDSDKERCLFFDKKRKKHKVDIKKIKNAEATAIGDATKENFRKLFENLDLKIS